MKTQEDVRSEVRREYGAVARKERGCCDASSCSSSEALGYGREELDAVPNGADLGLGCGNPGALAELKAGEVVVDLGAGAGLDALIAARKVGPQGRVIGVDMTPEMLKRARRNAVEAGVEDRVEFREGIIEDLPVVSGSADVVISNCVINLSPDKPRVFREAFRVLKPGGRLALTDIVLDAPLPPAVRELAGAYVACVAGALLEADYFAALRDAGFVDVEHTRVPAAPMLSALTEDPTVATLIATLDPAVVMAAAEAVYSYRITARKP